MINLQRIREAILQGLRDYLRQSYADFLIILANPDAPEPDTMPFMTMDITSPFIPEGINHAETTAASGDNLLITQSQNAKMSISFNVHSKSRDESTDIALKAQEYFHCHGYEELQAKGVVVAESYGLQNREGYIGDSWERWIGFDFVFRVYGYTQKQQDRIVAS